MSFHRKGFTLAEVLVAMTLMTMLMAAVFQFGQAGTNHAQKSRSRAETAQEAAKILAILKEDLRSACMPVSGNRLQIRLGDWLTATGTSELPAVSFYSFPRHVSLEVAAPRKTVGKSVRPLARISWRMIPGRANMGEDGPVLEREEVFEASHTVLLISRRSPQLTIRVVEFESGNQREPVFWVNLRLRESEGSGAPRSEGGQRETLEFYTVVVPEAFEAMWNNSDVRPPWHTILVGP